MANDDGEQIPAEQAAPTTGGAGDSDATQLPITVALAAHDEPHETPFDAPLDTAIRSSPYADREPAWLARLALAVSALATLVVVVSTQVQLSGYAAGGGGAAEVAAPALPVAISLIGSLVVALLLSNRELRALALRLRRSGLRATLHTLIAAINLLSDLRRAWHIGVFQLTCGSAALRHRLAVRHSPPTFAYPPVYPPPARLRRQDAWVIGLLVALLLSLVADFGAAYLALRPIAQWFWLGSVALLILVAWVWTEPPIPLLRGEQRQRRGQPLDDPTGGSWRAAERGDGLQPPARPRMLALDLSLLAILTSGALALRLPNLTALPYVVHGDEAQCGLEALRWLHGQVPSLLSVGWFGLPEAGYGLPALVMAVAGPTALLGDPGDTLDPAALCAGARVQFAARRISGGGAAVCVAYRHPLQPDGYPQHPCGVCRHAHALGLCPRAPHETSALGGAHWRIPELLAASLLGSAHRLPDHSRGDRRPLAVAT